MSGVTPDIVVDDRLESYTTFFDPLWETTIAELVRGTKLELPVLDLCINWNAAARVCSLPWLMCTSMGKLSSLAAHELWTALLNGEAADEFKHSICGSQRMSYEAIYYAYESFIRDTLGVALGIQDYTVSRISDLKYDCEALFGTPTAALLLADAGVGAARLVRDALVHNGGKETSGLHGIAHGIRVENGELQIMAPDTRRLFDLLKVRAFTLAAKAITHPSIRL